MTKKQSGLLVHAKLQGKNVKHIPDNEIDFSDIPESTTEELARARRVGRPPTGNAKLLIAMRISPKLLLRLRKLATKKRKPYQTLMHEILEKGVEKEAS